MATFAGSEFNDLAKLLFKCLSTTNLNFDPLMYIENFEKCKTNVSRVEFVLKDMQRYPKIFAKFTKDKKDDQVALKHYENGRFAFNNFNYWDALENYTQCIACAENPRTLAMGHRNRAECFLQLKMKTKCEEEIKRAKSHSLKQEIDDFIAKLNQIEDSTCKTFEPIPGYINFHPNDNIQSANNCVKIGPNLIVASRDIEIGEILAIEKPWAAVLTTDRLTHCHECLCLCYNLIPCPKCTVALFCSELCKDKARSYHKYECPILLTICYRALCEFAIDEAMLLAFKVAILAKDDYSNLDYMRLDGTYRSDRYNEVHFLKPDGEFSRFEIFHQAILTAFVFDLLWQYTSFFSGIFFSTDTQIKFKDVFMMQLQRSHSAVKIYEFVQKFDFYGTANYGLGAYSFFSLFPHSCCANVMKTYHGNVMVLRAINTIKEGEVCFVNRFGLRYDVADKKMRQKFLSDYKIPSCECKACKEDWVPNLDGVDSICEKLDVPVMELGEIVTNLIGINVDKASVFLPLLKEELEKCEMAEPDGSVLALKHLIVHCFVIFGNKKIQYDGRDVVFEL
ncbi:SET and MYND domain-containing protein 4-like Protein [Tribolium castaneum]|uniref:SET and MYND domain-containing protein 4-like Protein n=1 Tax=Tribolium castaneum TaxID=7070 RepID=D6WV83_TRICA|nr:PREDICTED: uncharacterized protein LOC100141902 [Tribolium castaneum]XP_008197487.1 PREDICTED: uncharacterized protein LOC100141902 [Tribolium castaneum]EFA07766.1 SET and MYND domain-containing protein 4-like Protein [Tribolium castaneum]|eukprot:XP_001815228.2 PREDICTED: uncharacterized protein LOC100141902 [Tribolium castaneum]